MTRDDRYPDISDLALIGDCHSSALVDRDGSIVWACLRRFDAGGAFCKLLDAERGGSFELAAHACEGRRRAYVRDTNVLETELTTATGRARLLDGFAMRRGGRRRPYQQLLRVVEGIEGETTFDVLLRPRFDMGSLPPWLRHHPEEGVYSAVGGDDALVITAGCDLHVDREDVCLRGRFTVKAGERCRFSIVASMAHEVNLKRMSDERVDARLEDTIAWWRRWVARGHYEAQHRDHVVRSALVLKALTSAPTGAVIAAPTTSLPETPGGERNWDYRYTWIRDATLTLAALYGVGHSEVATGFKRFIHRTTAGRAGDLQIMYRCFGERRLPELEMSHLEGYRGARPVREGNDAANQKQHDVFGELLDVWHLWTRMGNELTADEWRFLRGLVDAARASWDEPDQGLWEMRGPARHFVYSKVMCWVALDRGVELAERHGMACELQAWRAARAEIRDVIERRGVDRERNCFVQCFDDHEMDASLLRLPMVGFVAADDPRMLATVEHIERELGSDGLLVRRYRPQVDDGLGGTEGFFLMTSFWLVEVLAMQGRVEEAEARFRRLLALGNDLHLFSEEYSPEHGQLGNFPQAFTHVSIIEAAEAIADARRHGRAERTASGHRLPRREVEKAGT